MSYIDTVILKDEQGKTRIVLKRCGLGNDEKFIPELVDRLLTPAFCSLKDLDLYANLLSDQQCNDLARLIELHPSLERIQLEQNKISDKGAEILYVAAVNSRVIVNIKDNAISKDMQNQFIELAKKIEDGDKNLQANIAEYLTDGENEISFFNNSLGNRHCKSLAELIEKHPTLVDLDLGGNKISDAGAQILLDAVRKNPRVTVKMDGNSISEAMEHEFKSLTTEAGVRQFVAGPRL